MKQTYTSVLVVALVALLFSPSQASAQAPPLGSATSFGVLGGSTVTNTGLTAVTGDVGVSPGTAITGFPPGTVTGGTIRANDAVAQQAQSDLTVAYNALAALPCGTVLTGQDLGGLTLGPGVYCFASSAQLTGTLTLDAQGNPSAQFIFQIGSTLTTASNSVVRTINGGQNCNVYWQVGSSATIGTATALTGSILALANITLTTSANVSGRLLARNGAVTLASNSIAVCTSCNPITLSPSTLPDGTIGAAYSQTITASGGTMPYTFTVVAGSLPTGLTLAAGGALSGTPTATGSFTFTVRATDAGGCFGSRIYTIVINPAPCSAISLLPSTIPAGTAGASYGPVTITASGGTSPYGFAVTSGSLPPGLALSPAGAISGTPTQFGSFTFTITATDAAGCVGSRIYTALVNCPAITLAPTALPDATVRTAYVQTISASGGSAPYGFTLLSGSLPAGLALSAAGALSGTPTTPGSSTFTVQATGAGGCLGVRTYTLIVNPAPCPTITVAPSTLSPATAGVAYGQALTASGGASPYTFAVTFGTLPPGLSLTAAGLLSGTATGAGGFTFTVTATDSLGCLGTRIYTLSVNCPAISLAPAILPYGTVGTAYSQTITASGGTPPYTYTLVSGTLPAGLALSAAGTLSGTPTTPGNSTFTIRATHVAGCLGERIYTLIVNAAPCPTITVAPSTLSPATVGIVYGQTLTASRGTAPYTFAVTFGTLPPGLSLSGTGLLTGTPTQSGNFTFTVTATDSLGCLGTRIYALAVNCPTITLAPAALPVGTVGSAYSQAISAGGGTAPYGLTLLSGTLPAGLSLSVAGTLSGTPTTPGNSTFTVRATDAGGCIGVRIYTLIVNAAPCPTITVSPSLLSTPIVGIVYGQTLTASGGAAPYSFAVTFGTLPPGLSLSVAGLLSGIPTVAGGTTFTVTATDALGCLGSRVYTLAVNCPTITLAPATLPDGTVGTAYSRAISASGGTAPYSFTLLSGSLPPGLSLSVAGILSGTPTTPGNSTFTLRATDGGGCIGVRIYTLIVNAAPCPTITLAPSALSPATVGIVYAQAMTASGGMAPYNFAVTSGALPPGLALTAAGLLSGTPTEAGGSTFTVTATDALGCLGTRIETLVVNCPPITISPAALADGTVGTSYSQAISASGGAVPYSFTLLSGTLPAGLSLSIAGTLSGTPTTPGHFTFTLRATDAEGCLGVRIYTLIINPAPCPTITVAPSTLAPATVGIAYGQTLTASGGTPPYTFAVTFGTLPLGLSLSAAGVLSGTPTEAGATTFTVTATDALGCLGGRVETLLVNCPTITLAPAELPDGTVGTGYSRAITASGGTAPYSFTLLSGSLPPGLSLSVAGTLSGTPTTPGHFTFTLRATDAEGCLSVRIYTLIINAAPCPTITVVPATLAPATVGLAYGQTFTASGGTAPYTFAVTFGTLPLGLSLSASGVLSGTPTEAGGSTFTVTATDALGCLGGRIDTLEVNCPVITLAPTTLPNGAAGAAYSPVAITVGGGTAPYTFTVVSGSLPPGMSLSPALTLSGTPTMAGTFVFTITVTDSAGCRGVRSFTLVVAGGVDVVGGSTLGMLGLSILTLLLAAAGVFLVNRIST